MKALIRKEGETVRETDGITGIDWKTGAPLTDPAWCGGPYQMVDNYVEVADGVIYDVAVYPESEDEPEDPAETEDEDPVDQPVVTDEYVIIDGVKYRRA